MLYPQNLEQKLGFDKIREMVKDACISPLGQAYVEKIRFSDDYTMIDKLVRQTAEFKEILLYQPDFPNTNFIDATPHLTKAAIEGTFLSEEEFFDLKLSLQTIAACLKFVDNQEENRFPQLKALSEGITFDKNLLDKISLVIDDRGHLRDNASAELQHIRRQLTTAQNDLRKKLDSILKAAKASGYVSDDASPTIRGGRMVIPVQAEHKRRVKGFVQDESATGQTLFIEPVEVLEGNNEIRELEYAERREIVRILTELTNQIRPFVQNLRRSYNFLGIIDFVRAKAKFAIQTEAVNPVFVNRQVVKWENATHPVLKLSLAKQGRQIVPLNIKLSPEYRILLISGPNAGGKSVTLKTVGLIQYMYQCGFLVPMAEHSEIGIFRNIFIDIGDEQSIENDLSTYSSHLTNMRHFLKFSNKSTLFLIDEFGTGTEPNMGGAIAESILEKLNSARAFGVINTHYTNLKLFAENTSGIENGAMRFDTENLEPLYMLEIGKPGSSFAFEIAHKIGLDEDVIIAARKKAGEKQVDFDKLLRELEVEKRSLSLKSQELKIREKDLKNLQSKYEELKNEIEVNKKIYLNKAKTEAKELLAEANRKIENTIRAIRENQADKSSTKKLRQELEKFETGISLESVDEPVLKDEEEDVIEVIGGDIEIGSFVRIKGQTAIGEVLLIKGKDAEIRIGELKSTIKLNRLEKISRKEYKKQTQDTYIPALAGINLNEKMANFSYQLDLRGKRGEEAIQALEEFIDDALMLGQPELRILHGKGDGILRNLVRTQLKSYKEVASVTDEHADRGGAGITIVKMK
jgi:DNA mismatch repair protein MutS2